MFDAQASLMFEFERNIAYQQEIFAKRHAGDDDGVGERLLWRLSQHCPIKHMRFW